MMCPHGIGKWWAMKAAVDYPNGNGARIPKIRATPNTSVA